ncbi:MAG: ArsR family transcriptional regulator [Pseudomonadota bacterium]
MTQPTRRQLAVLHYIRHFIQIFDYPPTVREIGWGVGLRSPSTVSNHLRHLVELGLIERQAGRARTLRVTPAGQAMAVLLR